MVAGAAVDSRRATARPGRSPIVQAPVHVAGRRPPSRSPTWSQAGIAAGTCGPSDGRSWRCRERLAAGRPRGSRSYRRSPLGRFASACRTISTPSWQGRNHDARRTSRRVGRPADLCVAWCAGPLTGLRKTYPFRSSKASRRRFRTAVDQAALTARSTSPVDVARKLVGVPTGRGPRVTLPTAAPAGTAGRSMLREGLGEMSRS